MSVLWTAREMAEATGGRLQGDWSGVSGLAIDNREMDAGDLFIALQGISHDGHVYVARALEAGAGAAMVSHIPEDVPAGAPLLVVDDTLKALEALGIAGRARVDAKVIGVTGSVGKTGTKDMLRAMLSAQGRTHAATRSFNNHWGVPLTLARMPADTEYAVIEIGMNHPGEITPLSKMARPHVALITTVEAVHMVAFESVEQIADAKAESFAGLEPGGVAILNADNPHFERLKAATDAKVLDFGRSADAFRLVTIEVGSESTRMIAVLNGAEAEVQIGAPGEHLAMNALAALSAVTAVGADTTRAAEALASWTPPSGRGMRARFRLPGGGEFTLLDESYNANPASMGAALSVLAAAEPGEGPHRAGHRTAFLGDMLELGPTERALHAALARHPAVQNIDQVHCCGPLMQALHDALPADKQGTYCADSVQLAQIVEETVDAGDVVMVKGSLGAAMRHVVSAIKALGTELPDSVPHAEGGA